MAKTQLSHQQTHNYQQYSEEFSKLGIQGSYYLAFSEVSKLLQNYGYGRRALDFGCGSGRSTRFLKNLGFETVGVDINSYMLNQARQLDPEGSYYLIHDKNLSFEGNRFDLIFQSFVLFEYPTKTLIAETLQGFHSALSDDGLVLLITGSEEYYSRDWASFQNNIPENQRLQSGDTARISIRETNIVLWDYYWSDQDYHSIFEQSGFDVVEISRPLAQGNEPFQWVSELQYPCWTIYLLQKNQKLV